VTNIDVDRNRSSAADRPRSSSVVPKDSDGRDGDQRFVVVGNDTFLYSRVNGRWKKVQVS
jgi:hypothetical protein